MGAGDFRRDVEAKPEPLLARGAFFASKGFEQDFKDLWRDGRAAIGNRKSNSRSVLAGAYANRDVLSSVGERIGEKIRHDLSQPSWIAKHGQGKLDVGFDDPRANPV